MRNFIIILMVVITTSVFGQENKKSEMGGPPNLSELYGFWKMKEFPNRDQMNRVNPWPQKYQWFAFNENGKVQSMMTNEDYDYSAKELSEIFNVLPSDKTPNYKLEGQFITIDNPSIKNYSELWGVNLFAKDANDFLKKGDLIMTLDDGEGSPAYYRLLEPIK
jgi:hypothetical protein